MSGARRPAPGRPEATAPRVSPALRQVDQDGRLGCPSCREGTGAGRCPLSHAASIEKQSAICLWKCGQDRNACRLTASRHRAGHVGRRPHAWPTWLTYQQVAERLGLRSASARPGPGGKCPTDQKRHAGSGSMRPARITFAAGAQKPRARRQAFGPAAADACTGRSGSGRCAAAGPIEPCRRS